MNRPGGQTRVADVLGQLPAVVDLDTPAADPAPEVVVVTGLDPGPDLAARWAEVAAQALATINTTAAPEEVQHLVALAEKATAMFTKLDRHERQQQREDRRAAAGVRFANQAEKAALATEMLAQLHMRRDL